MRSVDAHDFEIYLPVKRNEDSDKMLFYDTEQAAYEALGDVCVGDRVLCITKARSWVDEQEFKALAEAPLRGQ